MAESIVVRVMHSANGMRKGDTGRVAVSDQVTALIKSGILVEVKDDGTGKAGPGRPAPGDPGRVGKGAEERGAAGGEPGEGFGTGGYGSAASFD